MIQRWEGAGRIFQVILGIIVIAGIIAAIGVGEMMAIMSGITLPRLIALTLLQLGTLYLTSTIWYLLLREKSSTITPSSVFLITMAGTFIESITPSVKLGGEAMKIYLMKKKSGLSYQELTGVAIASKIFYLVPFLLISLITIVAAFFILDLPAVVYSAFAGLLICCCLLCLLLFRTGEKERTGKDHPIIQRIRTRTDAARSFLSRSSGMAAEIVRDPKKSATLYLLAFIVWAFYPVKVYLVAYLLGFQVSPIVIIIATFTAYLVSMIPLLPGGLVTFEGTMVLVLVSGGMALPDAAAVAIMTRCITFWIPLLLSAAVTLFFIQERRSETVSSI
ncbi:hypothetical protein RJ53_08885 [Methanocalculus chunghsingensis]|uniref:Uncharacterized protein n=1 Tax=Methanocalculus chunghsingensis TaxID=156457 RepID=A0A8J7WBD4_9EURY|nr:lysylphosphatidylglycerol synthase transmembrane domain-containing protein [Methanocalculus chunghsingensis]MBR1369592.1 hypothetical protein [Methanocalculus chunghsingensis]